MKQQIRFVLTVVQKYMMILLFVQSVVPSSNFWGGKYMAFCGKCGAQLDGGKFCPNCGTPIDDVEKRATITATAAHKPKRSGVQKKVVVGIIAIAVMVFIITRFTSTVNEPCDWCGNSPSVAYKLNDGSYSYVCKDCSEYCAFCGEKATKHY